MKFNERILKHTVSNFSGAVCSEESKQQLAKEISLPTVDLGGSTLSVIGSQTATETVWQSKYGTYFKININININK